MRTLRVDDELLAICRAIVAEARAAEEWAEVEADDYFQSEHYTGGFDATEGEFTFSYYDPTGREWWFQLRLEQVQDVLEGGCVEVPLRSPG